MQNLLSISEFGRLVGIDRKTLIFYDQTGILQPVLRESNGYRFYSVSQVSELCILLTLQELGLSLKEIRAVKNERSTAVIDDLFMQQTSVLEARIKRLQSTMDMIKLRRSQIDELKRVETNVIKLQWQEPQYYYQSPLCRIDRTEGYNQVWEQFYNSCERDSISQGYPVCYMLGIDDVQNRRSREIQRIAFHVTEISLSNYQSPPGQYAIAFISSSSVSDDDYGAILDYISACWCRIAGGAIEEVICDEVYTLDSESFITMVRIPVV